MKYLGNKDRLLDSIEIFLNKKGITLEGKSVLDGFSGTGAFAKLAFKLGAKKVTGFELLESMVYYAEYNVNGLAETDFNNIVDNFCATKEGYFYNNLSKHAGRQYFSDENSKKIDHATQFITTMSPAEKGLFVDLVDRVSNTTGTYGAFLKIWRGMALKTIESYAYRGIHNNFNYEVKNESLIGHKEKYDFVYLDPPYNTRQYASNYHVLDRIFEQKVMSSKTGVTGEEVKSPFASKVKAKTAFKILLEEINSKQILVSYSNEGILDADDWADILFAYDYEIEYFSYRRFKTNSATKADTGLKEMLILINK